MTSNSLSGTQEDGLDDPRLEKLWHKVLFDCLHTLQNWCRYVECSGRGCEGQSLLCMGAGVWESLRKTVAS